GAEPGTVRRRERAIRPCRRRRRALSSQWHWQEKIEMNRANSDRASRLGGFRLLGKRIHRMGLAVTLGAVALGGAAIIVARPDAGQRSESGRPVAQAPGAAAAVARPTPDFAAPVLHGLAAATQARPDIFLGTEQSEGFRAQVMQEEADLALERL